jgi:hypothetical protein
MSESGASNPQTGGSGFPPPPATFDFLVFSLKTQAEMSLGLLPFGSEEDRKPDFVHCRHAIDLLAMLQEKTRGNLSLDEQRLLENSLTELRFRFVQVLEETGKKRAAEKPADSQESSAESKTT